MRDDGSVWWTYLLTRDTTPYHTRRLVGPRETAYGYDIPVPVNLEAEENNVFTSLRSYRGIWLATEVYLWIAYILGKDEDGVERVDLIGHLILGKGEENEIALSLLGVGRRLWRLEALAKIALEHRRLEDTSGRATIKLVIGPPSASLYPIDSRRWPLPEFVIDQLYGGIQRLRDAFEETIKCLRLGLEPRYKFVYLALTLKWGPFDEEVNEAICDATCYYDSITKYNLESYYLRRKDHTFCGLDGLERLFADSSDLDFWGLDGFKFLYGDD